MDMRSPQWNESQGDTAVTGRTTTENLIHAHTPVRKARHHYHLSFHYTYYLCMRQAFEALNIYIQVAAKNQGFEMHKFFLSVSDFIHNCHFTDKKKTPTLIISRCFFRAHGVFLCDLSLVCSDYYHLDGTIIVRKIPNFMIVMHLFISQHYWCIKSIGYFDVFYSHEISFMAFFFFKQLLPYNSIILH